MPTVRFRGRIMPGHDPITTPPLPPFETVHSDGKKYVYTVRIEFSVIHVVCVVESFHPDWDISPLLIDAIVASRAALDCLCFAHGLGLSAVIEWMIQPDGIEKPLRYTHSQLKPHCTAFNLTPGYTGKDDFAAMYTLVLREPGLLFALNELLVAITLPEYLQVNCARAIESLRTMLVPKDSGRAKGWVELRRVLCVEESYVRHVIDASVAPRHGEKTFPTRAEGREILDRAWIIMNRFLEFRKRGSFGLPVNEFPVLS
jgi:hypothetical protein